MAPMISIKAAFLLSLIVSAGIETTDARRLNREKFNKIKQGLGIGKATALLDVDSMPEAARTVSETPASSARTVSETPASSDVDDVPEAARTVSETPASSDVDDVPKAAHPGTETIALLDVGDASEADTPPTNVAKDLTDEMSVLTSKVQEKLKAVEEQIKAPREKVKDMTNAEDDRSGAAELLRSFKEFKEDGILEDKRHAELMRTLTESRILAGEFNGVTAEQKLEETRCQILQQAIQQDVWLANEKLKDLKDKGEDTDVDLRELVEAFESHVGKLKGCGVTEEDIPRVKAFKKRVKVIAAWQAVQKDVNQASEKLEHLKEDDKDIDGDSSRMTKTLKEDDLKKLVETLKSIVEKLQEYGVTEEDIPKVQALNKQVEVRAAWQSVREDVTQASEKLYLKEDDKDIDAYLEELVQALKLIVEKLKGRDVAEKDIPEVEALNKQLKKHVEDRATCKPGQSEPFKALFESGDNSWIKCRAKCIKDDRCVGFDYTVKPGRCLPRC